MSGKFEKGCPNSGGSLYLNMTIKIILQGYA